MIVNILVSGFPRSGRSGSRQRELHTSSQRRRSLHESQRGQRDRQPVPTAGQETQSEEEEMKPRASHRYQQTHICHSGRCFEQPNQWFPPHTHTHTHIQKRRLGGAAPGVKARCVRRDQRQLFLHTGTSTHCCSFFQTDLLLLNKLLIFFGHFCQKALTCLKHVWYHFVSNIKV